MTYPTPAYNNDPQLKASAVELAASHAQQDSLQSGIYGHLKRDGTFTGCSVGCMAHDLDPTRAEDALAHEDYHDLHRIVSEELGLPLWLIEVEDRLFENLPATESNQFHADFFTSIPVGIDLNIVELKLRLALAIVIHGCAEYAVADYAERSTDYNPLLENLVKLAEEAVLTTSLDIADGGDNFTRTKSLRIRANEALGAAIRGGSSQYIPLVLAEALFLVLGSSSERVSMSMDRLSRSTITTRSTKWWWNKLKQTLEESAS